MHSRQETLRNSLRSTIVVRILTIFYKAELDELEFQSLKQGLMKKSLLGAERFGADVSERVAPNFSDWLLAAKFGSAAKCRTWLRRRGDLGTTNVAEIAWRSGSSELGRFPQSIGRR